MAGLCPKNPCFRGIGPVMAGKKSGFFRLIIKDSKLGYRI